MGVYSGTILVKGVRNGLGKREELNHSEISKAASGDSTGSFGTV